MTTAVAFLKDRSFAEPVLLKSAALVLLLKNKSASLDSSFAGLEFHWDI